MDLAALAGEPGTVHGTEVARSASSTRLRRSAARSCRDQALVGRPRVLLDLIGDEDWSGRHFSIAHRRGLSRGPARPPADRGPADAPARRGGTAARHRVPSRADGRARSTTSGSRTGWWRRSTRCPDVFRERLGSVAITIEDWPSAEQLRAIGAPGPVRRLPGRPAVGATAPERRRCRRGSRSSAARSSGRARTTRRARDQVHRHRPPRDRAPLRDLATRACASSPTGTRRGRARPERCHTPRVDARILLVEDDPSIREVTALGLAPPGSPSTTAADGVEGLERWRADRPDLVLLDVMLPRLDGLEVLSRDPPRVDDADRDAHGARPTRSTSSSASSRAPTTTSASRSRCRSSSRGSGPRCAAGRAEADADGARRATSCRSGRSASTSPAAR